MNKVIILTLLLAIASAQITTAGNCNRQPVLAKYVQTLAKQLWDKDSTTGVKSSTYNEKVTAYWRQVLVVEKLDPASSTEVLPTVLTSTDLPATLTADKAPGFSWLISKKAKVCYFTTIKTDDGKGTNIDEPYNDVFMPIMTAYIANALASKTTYQRVLANLSNLITGKVNACAINPKVTTIPNIRVWAKTYTYQDASKTTRSGTWLINQIYKNKILIAQANVKMFRGVLALLFTGTDDANYIQASTAQQGQAPNPKIIFTKTDSANYSTAITTALTALVALKDDVKNMGTAFLTAFGSAACTTDAKYYPQFKTIIDNWSGLANDATNNANFPLQGWNVAQGSDAKEFVGIVDAPDQASVEPTGRLLQTVPTVVGSDIVAAADDTKGISQVADATNDKTITIGGVDSNGNCASGNLNCTTAVPTPTPAPASTSSSSTNSNILVAFGALVALVLAL